MFLLNSLNLKIWCPYVYIKYIKSILTWWKYRKSIPPNIILISTLLYFLSHSQYYYAKKLCRVWWQVVTVVFSGGESLFSPRPHLTIRHRHTGCFYRLSPINLVWGPLKYFKSNFNPVHVFLHFKSFCLVVLKLILASKLRELYSNLKIELKITSKQA